MTVVVDQTCPSTIQVSSNPFWPGKFEGKLSNLRITAAAIYGALGSGTHFFTGSGMSKELSSSSRQSETTYLGDFVKSEKGAFFSVQKSAQNGDRLPLFHLRRITNKRV